MEEAPNEVPADSKEAPSKDVSDEVPQAPKKKGWPKGKAKAKAKASSRAATVKAKAKSKAASKPKASAKSKQQKPRDDEHDEEEQAGNDVMDEGDDKNAGEEPAEKREGGNKCPAARTKEVLAKGKAAQAKGKKVADSKGLDSDFWQHEMLVYMLKHNSHLCLLKRQDLRRQRRRRRAPRR